MTPAERLRAAADLIERTGAAATPGICPDWIYNAVRHIARNCGIECGHDEHDNAGDPAWWDRYTDAAWIALLGPDVAPALAAWLRGALNIRDGYMSAVMNATEGNADEAKAEARFWASTGQPALAFADLILRGQS